MLYRSYQHSSVRYNIYDWKQRLNANITWTLTCIVQKRKQTLRPCITPRTIHVNSMLTEVMTEQRPIMKPYHHHNSFCSDTLHLTIHVILALSHRISIKDIIFLAATASENWQLWSCRTYHVVCWHSLFSSLPMVSKYFPNIFNPIAQLSEHIFPIRVT